VVKAPQASVSPITPCKILFILPYPENEK